MRRTDTAAAATDLDSTRIRFHIDDAVLDDLRSRLGRTRWMRSDPTGDGAYGVRAAVLRRLARHWHSGFDWGAAEARLNVFDHHQVTVDGVPIHFMRKAGVGPAPRPLILSHGWPWTFWHWSKVVDALADPGRYGADPAGAFDVIVPSLPGFGPSGTRAGMTFWRIADLWHTMMTEVLGHERYVAAGCDVGALVTGQLGHKYADHLDAIHIGSGQRLDLFTGDRAWDVTGGRPLPPTLPADLREQIVAVEHRFAVHLAAQVLAPDTLGHALTDSPAGMLAWVLERWEAWSDNHGDIVSVFTDDDILTHATILWAGDFAGTMRIYADNNRSPWRPSHDRQPAVEAPTGLTFVGYENPPGVGTQERVAHYLSGDRARWYNLVNVTAHERGGHFIPWEAPEAWVGDLRRTVLAASRTRSPEGAIR